MSAPEPAGVPPESTSFEVFCLLSKLSQRKVRISRNLILVVSEALEAKAAAEREELRATAEQRKGGREQRSGREIEGLLIV